jgi:hypothetical protein
MNPETVQHPSPEQMELTRRREEDAQYAKRQPEAALEGKPAEGTTMKSEEAPVEIPDTPVTRKARAMLRDTLPDWTSELMDKLLREHLMLTTPVRKALVAEEIARRANVEEDRNETAVSGPAAPAQSRQESQRRVEGVSRGEYPFVHIPEGMNFKPEGVYDVMRTAVKGAGAFSGMYYHDVGIPASDIRRAARNKKDPQAALDALVAKWGGDETPAELASHNRDTLRQKAPQLLTVLVVAAGVVAWLYHSHEVKRRASEAAEAAEAAKELQARLVVAGVRNAWNAIDDWEDGLPSKNAAFTTYTIDLENALIKGRPVIAFGLLDDVRKSAQQDNPIVLFQDMARTRQIDLRFSLSAAPATTKAFLDHKDQNSDMFVLVATITSVEKVTMPPDNNDNDQDYFLAHGILHEAQSIGFRDQPPKK